jgi:hypothetical protein
VSVLLGYAALLLPWMTGTRVAFLYQLLAFLRPVGAGLLAPPALEAPTLDGRRFRCLRGSNHPIHPMTMALPISPESLRQCAWLESWLGG